MGRPVRRPDIVYDKHAPRPVYDAARRAEILEILYEHLQAGKTEAQVCRMPGMPSAMTMRDWRMKDPKIDEMIGICRDMGESVIASDCIDISDDLTEDPASRRVRVETRLKLLAVFNPRKYAPRMGVEHTGSVAMLTEAQLDAQLERFLGGASILDAGTEAACAGFIDGESAQEVEESTGRLFPVQETD